MDPSAQRLERGRLRYILFLDPKAPDGLPSRGLPRYKIESVYYGLAQVDATGKNRVEYRATRAWKSRCSLAADELMAAVLLGRR